MSDLLVDIAERLSAGALTIDIGPQLANVEAEVWTMSNLLGGKDVRVLVITDDSAHSSFRVPAFARHAAKYIVPIVTRIGDAHDQVVERHAGEGSNR